MTSIFGTDGIRGRANQWPMTPDLVLQVGRSIALRFRHDAPLTTASAYKHFNPYVDHANHQFTVVIGKDTRLSGYMIESALVAGLVAEGANVIMLGPIPTPAIAMLARSLRADIGIMISASHNPYYDNGIKFFDSNGVKFSEEIECEIETIVKELLSCNSFKQYPIRDCGKSMRLDDAAGRYVEFAKATFPSSLSLEGKKIVLDCANGAAYKVAPRVFWELGASVISLGDMPNGRNINEDCGALHPESLQKCVLEVGADVGIALDGDADRLLLVTKKGQFINGDQIIALIASEWSQNGPNENERNISKRLKNGVVTTFMSNIGLKKYLEGLGIPHMEADIGDKNVFALMQSSHCNLGGEESGHIILSDYTTTGDGIIAALQVLGIVQNRNLDDVFPVFEPYYQIISSFKLNESMTDELISNLKHDSETSLGKEGRVVIRKSGTEPLLRVMVQHKNEQFSKDIFSKLIVPAITH
ncbi:MAG: phosphoglucosamine mutase [Holosporales bacterium]|jgi:phosphoglucosamine mutase|nr:phosphoglucosamine mutase [Holosporales bacterium]